MPINPAEVQWDDDAPGLTIDIVGGRRASEAPQIDASQVQWDDAPANVPASVGMSGVTRTQRQAQIAAADQQLNYDDTLAGLNTREQIGRSLGLGGRAILKGLAAIPDIVVAPATAALERFTTPQTTTADLVAGRTPQGVRLASIGETIDQAADYVGAPRPQNTQEEIASNITSGISGAATGIGLGNALAQSSRPVVAGIGNVLASNPGAQLAAATAGGGAGGAARAAGLGPGAELAASLAGGVTGGTAASATNAVAENALRVLASSSSAAERRAAADILKQAAQARQAAQAAGEQGAAQAVDEIAPNLQYTPSSVPGVTRTYGEGTLNPAAMALENRLRQQFPDVFTPADKANNAARMQALERIAGSPAKREAVESIRDQTWNDSMRKAMQAPSVDISKTIGVIDDTLSQKEGRDAVTTALEDVRKKLIRRQEVGGLQSETQEDRIHVLENVRNNIKDMLEGKYSGDTNKALVGSEALLTVRDALNAEIGEQVPAFTEALNAFRKYSRPLNRMDVGEELMNRAGNATDAMTGYRQLTPNGFAKAYNDLDAVAAKATGFKKAQADKILSPRDFESLAAMNDDFSRIYSRTTTAPQGSPTAGFLARGVGGLADMAISKVPYIGSKLQGLSKLADQSLDSSTKEKMAYLMANPKEMKRVMDSLPAKDAAALRKAASQIAYASNISAAESN